MLHFTSNPDFELLATLWPYLDLDKTPSSKVTTLLGKASLSARFGFSITHEQGLAAMIGVPAIPSAVSEGRTLFDIFYRLRLGKIYATRRDNNISFTFVSANSDGENEIRYRLKLPARVARISCAAESGKVLLVRMGGTGEAELTQGNCIQSELILIG